MAKQKLSPENTYLQYVQNVLQLAQPHGFLQSSGRFVIQSTLVLHFLPRAPQKSLMGYKNFKWYIFKVLYDVKMTMQPKNIGLFCVKNVSTWYLKFREFNEFFCVVDF